MEPAERGLRLASTHEYIAASVLFLLSGLTPVTAFELADRLVDLAARENPSLAFYASPHWPPRSAR